MRTRSSASSATFQFGCPTVRVRTPPAIVILELACSRRPDGGMRTSERDARKMGIEADIKKAIAVIPSAATINTVVGGISNGLAAAGAAKATVKNAIPDS